ncbi:MAG TPA: acyltransferase family protein [Acidimicrobiia bacterium]|nr:acyltransferase family protein [Acidimicrobiia bacterium]
MSGTEAPAHAVPARLPRLGYIPALDGLRALAVVAVLLYHGDVSWMRGGFLGVDVFFVISGYLITSLLLGDWREYRQIRFAHFYLRRARRLLPALFLMLGIVALYSLLFLPDTVSELRGQMLASAFYVQNWYLIFHKVSYFVSVGRPSLLQHVWSLAVEEQFYLFWPLILSVLLARWGRQRNKLLLVVLSGVLASTVLMAVLYEPFSDPSRVYFGTDTRAATMLVGAALAIIWTPWRLTRDTGRTAPLTLDVMAAVGLVGVVWFFLNAGQYDNWMYRGGFLVLALFSALLIAATVHPASRLSPAVFGQRVLVWVGVRSYGIYLWHWPIFMVTRPHADVPLTGIPLLVLRFALTFVFAALSFKYVEEPIRHGALGRRWAAFRRATGERRRQLATGFAAVGGALVAFIVVLAAGFANAEPTPRPPGLPPETAVVIRPTATTTTAPGAPAAPGTTAAVPTTTTVPASPGTQAAAATTPTTAAPATAPTPAPVTERVTAVGDSVMLGAANALVNTIGADKITVDAAESRQFSAGVDALQAYRDNGQLGDEVVVQLGTNGTVNPADFDRMMDILKNVKKVVIVNAKVPRPWEDEVNETLADGVARYKDKAVLADWHDVAAAHPEFFWDDGIHLRPEGAQFYAQWIATFLD